MDESTLLAHIADRSRGLAGGAGWSVPVGPGDDCAVVHSAGGQTLLLTVDQLVAGRHFEPGTDTDLIARKAVARSVSDIAAMGGTPAWGLATGLLPPGYPHADTLFDAMARWARRWSCPLVGGDVAFHGSPDHPLTLAVTVGGVMPDGVAPVLRSGAKPGDGVFVTGDIGGSFETGHHLRFEPALEAGTHAAAHGAHAMIDLSDGLGRDAGRVAAASGVVIELDAGAIPLRVAARPWRDAIADGEDYGLLIVGPDACAPAGATRIGSARGVSPGERPGAWAIDGDRRVDVTGLGWDHR